MSQIKVFTGPMFSSKTTSLLIDCQTVVDAGGRVVVYKPSIDSRYSADDIISHDGIKASALGLEVRRKPVTWTLTPEEIADLKSNEVDLVAIDEVQFFTNIDDVVTQLFHEGISVVCAGLDMDSNGEPFGSMGNLLAVADDVHKRKAECAICGEVAGRTFRKLTAPSPSKVLIGGENIYEARCYQHWVAGMLEWKTWQSKLS